MMNHGVSSFEYYRSKNFKTFQGLSYCFRFEMAIRIIRQTTIARQDKVCFLGLTDLWAVSIKDWRLNRHWWTNWLLVRCLRNSSENHHSRLRFTRKILEGKWSIKRNDGKSRFQLENINMYQLTFEIFNDGQ